MQCNFARCDIPICEFCIFKVFRVERVEMVEMVEIQLGDYQYNNPMGHA